MSIGMTSREQSMAMSGERRMDMIVKIITTMTRQGFERLRAHLESYTCRDGET